MGGATGTFWTDADVDAVGHLCFEDSLVQYGGNVDVQRNVMTEKMLNHQCDIIRVLTTPPGYKHQRSLVWNVSDV